jgi:predicted metal-dependent hydrolase
MYLKENLLKCKAPLQTSCKQQEKGERTPTKLSSLFPVWVVESHPMNASTPAKCVRKWGIALHLFVGFLSFGQLLAIPNGASPSTEESTTVSATPRAPVPLSTLPEAPCVQRVRRHRTRINPFAQGEEARFILHGGIHRRKSLLNKEAINCPKLVLPMPSYDEGANASVSTSPQAANTQRVQQANARMQLVMRETLQKLLQFRREAANKLDFQKGFMREFVPDSPSENPALRALQEIYTREGNDFFVGATQLYETHRDQILALERGISTTFQEMMETLEKHAFLKRFFEIIDHSSTRATCQKYLEELFRFLDEPDDDRVVTSFLDQLASQNPCLTMSAPWKDFLHEQFDQASRVPLKLREMIPTFLEEKLAPCEQQLTNILNDCAAIFDEFAQGRGYLAGLSAEDRTFYQNQLSHRRDQAAECYRKFRETLINPPRSFDLWGTGRGRKITDLNPRELRILVRQWIRAYLRGMHFDSDESSIVRLCPKYSEIYNIMYTVKNEIGKYLNKLRSA